MMPLGWREPVWTLGRRSPTGVGTAQLPVLLLLLSISPRKLTRPEHRPCPKTPVPWSSCTTTAHSSREPQRVILLERRRKTKEKKKPQMQT